MLEVIDQLVLRGVVGFDEVEEGQSGCQLHGGVLLRGALLAVDGCVVSSRVLCCHAPEQVHGGGGVGVHDVLHQWVAGLRAVVDADDVIVLFALQPLLGGAGPACGRGLGLHLAGGRLDVGPGGVGEEADVVHVPGAGGLAVLVGPVLHGLVLPYGSAGGLCGGGIDLLVVHEVGCCRGAVLLAGGVVGEDAEAAVGTGDGLVGDVAGEAAATRHAALCIDVEGHAALAVEGLSGALFEHVALRACSHHGYSCCE